MTIGRLAVLALIPVLLLGTVGVVLADDGAGEDDDTPEVIELRKDDSAGNAELVDDDEDDGEPTGDKDNTNGDDGTNGGENTGDHDDTRGDDGDRTGDATAGDDGTAGGDNTAQPVIAAPAPAPAPQPVAPAPAPAPSYDDGYSDDGGGYSD